MEFEKVAGFIALGWLIGAVLLMARLVLRGKSLADTLATKHPESYEALGRPRPGFWHGSRRSRFAQFMAHREYENLGDPALAARFENYRKSENRHLLALVASLAVVALLIFVVRTVG